MSASLGYVIRDGAEVEARTVSSQFPDLRNALYLRDFVVDPERDISLSLDLAVRGSDDAMLRLEDALRGLREARAATPHAFPEWVTEGEPNPALEWRDG